MPPQAQILNLFATIVLIGIVGCSERSAEVTESSAPPTPAQTESTTDSIYAAAVQHVARTDADRARDASRKPAAVLEFIGIEPGMAVLDLFSGGGYYTEVLSRVVGSQGRVFAHSNEAYAQFVGQEAISRYANDRLPNVEMIMAENDALVFPDASYDAVMMILAYHDIYYVSPDNGWPKIDGPSLLTEIADGLRPGGVLAVVDHHAAAGSARETGNTLHRIDPEIVISEVEAAGLELEASSDILRNMDDDHSVNMSAPEVRGNTDRFVFRFRKPK